MKRSSVLLTSILALAACGPAEVVVTAEIETRSVEAENAMDTTQLGDLEVWLLPYDRDVIFDSLANVAENPEPAVPQEIQEAQALVQEAQEDWRNLETRWNSLRDRLQTISAEMEQYNRGEARYVTLFRDFQDLEGEYAQVQRQMERAFQRFDSLQKANFAQAQQIRLERDAWADEAFADVGEVIRARLQVTGLDEHADTTDATGVIRFQVDPGDYWVHARYELPYSELYWNVPISAARGEPVQVHLTRENAEERGKL